MNFQKISDQRSVLVFFIAITMTLVIAGCGDNSIKKAEEFMEAGMYVQAANLLEKEIMDSPTNAKAHLLYGMCNTSLGKLREAESSFKSAIQLNPELGNRIGNDLLKLAKKSPADDKSRIFRMLNMAITYEPSLKNEVALYYVDLTTKAQSIEEIIDLLEVATSFDDGVRKSASRIILEKAKESAESGKLADSYAAISAAISIDKSNREIGVQILTDALTTKGREMPFEASKQVIENILTLDSDARHSIGGLLTKFAKDDLVSGNIDRSVHWIEYMLKEHITSSGGVEQIRSLLVDASNKTISNNKQYSDIMKILESHYPDIAKSKILKEKYLYGVYLWMSGNKTRALDYLREVPDKENKFGLAFINTNIPPKRYPVELSKKGDFGWGEFTFTVEAVEVYQDAKVDVYVRVKNHTDRNQHFIFFGEHGYEKWRKYANASDVARAFSGADDERFYIIDDFGNKNFSSPPHFLKTPNRKKFNSSNDAVVMNPKQEVIGKLSFGPISKGNTGITFVSPRHNGHQWEIKFDITLRQVKFNPF